MAGRAAAAATGADLVAIGTVASMADGTDALLDRFFEAIVRADLDEVASCYRDDVQVWHNVTGRALGKADSVALLRYWCDRVQGLRYDLLERHPFPGGAVQRHVVRGRAGAQELAAEICIVFHVDGGQITEIFEYLDPAAVSAVFGPATSPGG
jgi:ketosteroid isomerase-like protein